MKRLLALLLASLFVASNTATATAVVSTVPVYLSPGHCSNSQMEWWEDQGSDHDATFRMLKCLAKQRGLTPPGGVAKAVSVAKCESGLYDRAGGDGGKYMGIYQLGDAEFKAFSHQTPRWAKTEFKQNGWYRPAAILNARPNIMAALAHAHRYGWGAWSCA